jgi:hypothetical protein
MKRYLVLFISFSVIILISSCSKKEKVDQKTDEKGNEEVKKQTEDAERKRIADSITQAANEEKSKEEKVKTALEDEKIVNDTNGQWAIDAEASSTYAGENKDKNAMWCPNQMTGKPNVEAYGDQPNAWAPGTPDKGVEWVKLTFPKAVNATEIRVRQNVGPGSIIKVELMDSEGKLYTVFEGNDKTKYKKDEIQYFIQKFDKTTYKTKVVKITMATNTMPGWEEIDAVQLIGN